LKERDIQPCIPSRRNRKTPIPHDAALYRKRHNIENMFGRLKAWRRIATRYDRCPNSSSPQSHLPQPSCSGY